MHNARQNADGSMSFVQSDVQRESLRIGTGGAEFYSVLFTTIGAEGTPGADDIQVTIQLADRAGRSIAKQVALLIYPAVADGTKALSAVTTVTVVTGTIMWRPISTSTGPHYVLPDSTGLVVMTYNVPGGAATRTIVVILPDGRLVESGTVTWA